MGGHGSPVSNLWDFCMSHCCRAIPESQLQGMQPQATTQPGREATGAWERGSPSSQGFWRGPGAPGGGCNTSVLLSAWDVKEG